LQAACWAHAHGHSTRLPVRKPRGKVERSRRAVGVVERDGKILLLKRPPEGLLAGMWEFLNLEVDPGEAGETLTGESPRAFRNGRAHPGLCWAGHPPL